jgi:hypothetical protein
MNLWPLSVRCRRRHGQLGEQSLGVWTSEAGLLEPPSGGGSAVTDAAGLLGLQPDPFEAEQTHAFVAGVWGA